MAKIQICPECGFQALAVNAEAVKYNVNDSLKSRIDSRNKWNVCVNPECDHAYFSKQIKFRTSDLIVPLFFKDKSENVPICYCSDLTRGEIESAVENGCRSIKDVHNYTKKDVTGLCEKRNPLGRCCRNVFLRTISDSLNKD